MAVGNIPASNDTTTTTATNWTDDDEIQGPRHSTYGTRNARLQSYANWPLDVVGISPEILTDCGLFYMGVSDHVKCYYCDGGIHNWRKTDDPWREHKQLFPNCKFVQLKSEKRKTQEKAIHDDHFHLCKICFDAELEIIFIDCRHLVCCIDCSLMLKECPICKKALKNIMSVYWS
jgi:hypothetical protein